MFQNVLLSIEDSHEWNRLLPSSRSVFGSHGYASISARFRNCSPRLYVASSSKAAVCYPIQLRPLSELKFAANTEGEWDATTPDFTGPMLQGDEPELVEAFPQLRDKHFRESKIVAEFAHLHPWQEAEALLPEGRELNREIVWIDTTLSPEELWSTHFEHSCRKNIQTAQRSGITIFEGSTDAHLEEFYRIYRATMERNNALPSYYFSLEFFRAFRNELQGNSRFVMAEREGKIVAATLYLYDDQDVFSFLGGADAEFQQFRPTNMVIWDTIRWAWETGRKRLILGGGYKPDDGIFRFKSTFSRHRKPFHIYKRIHLDKDYRLLDRQCRDHYALNGDPISYFPSYRFVKSA